MLQLFSCDSRVSEDAKWDHTTSKLRTGRVYHKERHRRGHFILTLAAKGDHDVSGAAVDSCEPQRSDFGPNLQSFGYGVIDL